MTNRQRVMVAISIVILSVAIATLARAQTAYQPIPNFKGIGAGQQLLNALNNNFSGAAATSPSLIKVPFAQLPPEQDGQLLYCSNCLNAPACAAGGTGAFAFGLHGAWSCGVATVASLGGDVSGTVGANVVNTVLGGQVPISASTAMTGGDLDGHLPGANVRSLHLSVVTCTHASSPCIVSGFHATVACDATGGAVTISPGALASGSGQVITVTKVDATANQCDFRPHSFPSELVAGFFNQYFLGFSYQSATFYDSGAGLWSVLGLGGGIATSFNTGFAVYGSLSGTTAGLINCNQPFVDSTYNKTLCYLNGYKNATSTPQTFVFPFPFANTPYLAHDDSGGSSVSTTALTFPASMGTTKTGWVVVEGF